MTKPIETISVPSRGASISAAIWKNEVTQDDKSFTAYSVTIEKRFQKDGDWQSTSSFNANELPLVGFLSNKAFNAPSSYVVSRTDFQSLNKFLAPFSCCCKEFLRSEKTKTDWNHRSVSDSNSLLWQSLFIAIEEVARDD